MKNLFICWLATSLTLFATPDWADNTNESFLGSNEKFYATFLTETNNQGSYYERREVKKLNEYSKGDGSIVTSTIISDILYSIDANHNDPNTPAKVTKTVMKENKDVMLSTLLTNFHLPLIPAKNPDWITRLSWHEGNLVLDEQLTIVNKAALTELEIPVDHIVTLPIEKTILQVHKDADSIYLVIKVDTETDYNTHVLHLAQDITKQLRDRISILEEYVFIKSFKNFEEANAYGLELIKTTQTKHFFGLNPEIWLSKVEKNNPTPYLLLHRPLELPINQDQIKRLDTAIGIHTLTINSDHFVEKWIPFDPKATPDSEEEQDGDEAPQDLLDEEIE